MTPQPPLNDAAHPASIEYVQGVRDALDAIASGLKEHGNVDPEDIYQARVKFYGGDELMPPLPTEPNTVIAPRWRPRVMHTYKTLVLGESDTWWRVGVGDWHCRSVELEQHITGFKVLSEPVPRMALYEEQTRVARAIVAQVQEMPIGYRPVDVIDEIKRTYLLGSS